MSSYYAMINDYIDKIRQEATPPDVVTNAVASVVEPIGLSGITAFCSVLSNNLEVIDDDQKLLQDLQKWMDKFLKKEPVFQTALVKELEKAGYAHDYPAFYKQAEIDRRLFSKLVSETYAYHPDIKTVFKCIIGLHLNLEDAQRLLNASAYAFGTEEFNLVIRFCVENRIYDHDRIDELLYERGEDTLYSIA